MHSQKQNTYNTLQSSVVSENKGPFFRQVTIEAA